jgi:large subunit ribosomal protein L35
MPKQKTHEGTAKRIKQTSTGKLLRDRANGTHFQTKKSGSRKRVIASKARVRGALAGNIRRALGV